MVLGYYYSRHDVGCSLELGTFSSELKLPVWLSTTSRAYFQPHPDFIGISERCTFVTEAILGLDQGLLRQCCLIRPTNPTRWGKPTPESHKRRNVKVIRTGDPDQTSRIFVCFLAVPICVLWT